MSADDRSDFLAQLPEATRRGVNAAVIVIADDRRGLWDLTEHIADELMKQEPDWSAIERSAQAISATASQEGRRASGSDRRP